MKADQAPRPHSVMARSYNPPNSAELSLAPNGESTPGHFVAAPRPHSVLAHAAARPPSVAEEPERPHSVLGSATSSSGQHRGLRGSVRRPLQGHRVPERSESPERRDQSIPRQSKPDVVQRSQTPREKSP